MELTTEYAFTLRSVPKRFLEDLKDNAAVALEELCFRQEIAAEHGRDKFNSPIRRRWGTKGDKHTWYKPIADKLPWLSPSQLHKIIASPCKRGTRQDTSLEKRGYVQVDRDFSTYKFDNVFGMLAYSVPDKIMQRWRYQKNRVFYSSKDAESLGTVSRAIVLNLIFREFHLLGKKAEGAVTLAFNRAAMHRETGLPLMTISDAFRYLASPEVKILATSDGGKTHSLLLSNPITDKILKGRGEGRKAVANLAGIEGCCASNPNPCVPTFVRTPSNALTEATAVVLTQVETNKVKRAAKRRRGIKPVEKDAFATRPYTKHNEGYWKTGPDFDLESKPVRFKDESKRLPKVTATKLRDIVREEASRTLFVTSNPCANWHFVPVDMLNIKTNASKPIDARCKTIEICDSVSNN